MSYAFVMFFINALGTVAKGLIHVSKQQTSSNFMRYKAVTVCVKYIFENHLTKAPSRMAVCRAREPRNENSLWPVNLLTASASR